MEGVEYKGHVDNNYTVKMLNVWPKDKGREA